jgi:hypothetical protein
MMSTRTITTLSALLAGALLLAPGLGRADSDGAAYLGLGLKLSADTKYDARTGDAYYRFRGLPVVWSVTPGGPAHRAGVRRGDVLTHIHGVPFDSDRGGRLFSAVNAGDTVRVRCLRGKRAFETSWIVGQSPWKGASSFALGTVRTVIPDSGRARTRIGALKEARVATRVRATARARAEAREHALRYAGSLWGTDIEARGSADIVVRIDEQEHVVVMTSKDMTVRLKMPR